MIENQWGDLETMNTMSAATGVQGSGWGWLGYDKAGKKLVVTSTPNQDPLNLLLVLFLFWASTFGSIYYLQYKNVLVP